MQVTLDQPYRSGTGAETQTRDDHLHRVLKNVSAGRLAPSVHGAARLKRSEPHSGLSVDRASNSSRRIGIISPAGGRVLARVYSNSISSIGHRGRSSNTIVVHLLVDGDSSHSPYLKQPPHVHYVFAGRTLSPRIGLKHEGISFVG